MAKLLRDRGVQRRLFKYVNQLMLLLWRLGLGRAINSQPERFGRIMVLSTVGRRTGRMRRTPVNYAPGQGEVFCIAGFGPGSNWYRNLQERQDVELWLPDGRWSGRAEQVARPEAWVPVLRQVLINSGFASNAFAGVAPRTISDDELRALGQSWPVVRIRLQQPLRGPGGPGDLRWVWSVVGGLAFLLWLWRRRR